MKKNFQTIVFSLFIILVTSILPACQQEEITDPTPNQTSPQSITENVGCGVVAYSGTPQKGGFMVTNMKIILCSILEENPIPTLKDMIKSKDDMVLVPMNEKFVIIEYFATTLDRNEEFFILREAITLTQDMKQNLRTNGTLIAPGRYRSMYNKEENMYVALLPIQ